MKLSFEAVGPIFLLMLVGYIIKCTRMVDKKELEAINKLVFRIFLPTLLFYDIYSTKISEIIDVKLILFVIAGIIAVFAVGLIFTLLITKENTKRSVILQSLFRSNYAILGVPLVKYICGADSGGLASFMIVIIVPLFNILAVAALKIFGRGNEKLKISHFLKGIVTNPLIIGCITGLVFFLLDVRLPSVMHKAIGNISSVASPLAIIVLGAGFDFSDTRGYIKELIVSVSARLLIIPMLMLAFAVWLGFSGEALACVLVAFGAPVAVSSFSMVQQMGGDEKLAAQTIVITSVGCLITLFGWIFTLSYFNLF